MDTHSPRIVGQFPDPIEPYEDGVESGGPAARTARPPLRVQRVFTESDDARDRLQQNTPRPSKIKQMPLRLAERRTSEPAGASAPAVPIRAPLAAPEPDAPHSAVSTFEIARRIRKLSADLFLGAAVVTVNLAELAAQLIALVGLVVLIFPGQFVHTCLIALYWRFTGQEQNYGEAFVKSWNRYRGIPYRRWHVGSFEVSMTFLVGFALLSPLMILKFLELARALAQLSK